MSSLVSFNAHSLAMMRHNERMKEEQRLKREQAKIERLGDLPLVKGSKLFWRQKTKQTAVEFVKVKGTGKEVYVKHPKYEKPIAVPVSELEPYTETFVPPLIPTTTSATAGTTKKSGKKKTEPSEPPTPATPTAQEPIITKPQPQNACAPGAFFCNQTEINTRSKTIPAFYGLYELDTLITSHNPETFSADPRYPANCQQRDYTADAAEKNKVEQIAKNLKPHIVITNDPTAANGAPMITPDGTVLGGNGRTMGLKLFEKRASIQERALYLNYLKSSAAIFGLEPQTVDNFRFPVLVRVVDAPMSECAYYSNILNESLTQEVDFTTKTISLARQLQPEDLGKIAGIFEQSGLQTFAELMQSKSAVKQLVELFRKRGIITSQNISQFLDPRTVMPSPLGRLNIERVLLGAILTKKELVDAAQNYTNAIIRALPVLVKIQSFDADHNLTPRIEEAIRLEAERRSADQNKTQFLTQTAIGRDLVKDDVRIVWDALDSGQLGFKGFVERYAKLAEEETAQDGFGFYGKRSPLEMLRLAAQNKNAALGDYFTDTRSRPQSINQLRRLRVNYLPLSRHWREFFGSLEESFSMLIWGLPGQGKSSFILLFLQELQRHGRCLYLSTEETKAKIAHKANLMNVRSAFKGMDAESVSLNPLAAIHYFAGSRAYRFIVVDSISQMKMTQDQAQNLIAQYPHCNFIFISHSNKDGKTYAGSKEIAHAVDVVLNVKEGTATTTKNRFGETGREFQIFQKKG